MMAGALKLLVLLELVVLIVLSLISDIKKYKIKNRIVLPSIAAGIATNFLIHGTSGLKDSFAGTVIPVLVLFIFYALRMLGAGDIKLFSAIGAIMGMEFVLYSMAYSFLAGGVIALFILAINRNWKQRLIYFFNYFKACFLSNSLLKYSNFEEKNDKSKFPFAYAIACGVVICHITSNCHI